LTAAGRRRSRPINFGYFDSRKCYAYDTANNRFNPTRVTADKKCTTVDAEFSGDWLNYVTTSRLDALRKVLYGGLRSTDTSTLTVLERSNLPQDAHRGKSYENTTPDGYDITEYTPFSQPAANSSHLFANTTPLGFTIPRMRVLLNQQDQAGQPLKIWNWLSIERPVADTAVVVGINASGGEIRLPSLFRRRARPASASRSAIFVGLESIAGATRTARLQATGLLQDSASPTR
jgi:type IV pilus assembly protein PilY1